MHDFTVRHNHCRPAQRHHSIQVVTDEENRTATGACFFHLPEALTLKLDVANSKYFVNNQYIRLKVSSNGERQPHIHTGGIVFYGYVDKPFNFREGYDFIKPALYLAFRHTQDRAAQIDILPPRELRMESRSHFQQRAYASVNLCPALRWTRNPAQDL